MNKVAIYPGTFDPITYGHIDVIKKALKLFDKIVVGVSDVSNKNYLFNSDERIDIVNKALFKDLNLDKKKINSKNRNLRLIASFFLKNLPHFCLTRSAHPKHKQYR